MKKIFFSLALLFITLNLAAQVKYNSPLGNFKATFPDAPEYKNSDVDINNRTVKLHMFMYSETDNIFMVACADYPDGFFDAKEIREQYFISSADGFFGELNIIAGNAAKVKSGKYKGASYKGQGTDYGVLYHVYIAKNTIFQVVIMSNGAYPDEKAAKSFFKSFRITI